MGRFHIVAAWFSIILASACDPNTRSRCTPGVEDCSCTAERACDTGLICQESQCVDPASLCGNGIVEQHEVCDDANTTSDVPDVILNSWGVPRGLFIPCSQTFWEVIDNVEAAGIVTVFAAGNEGPNPQTMRDPADRAATPLNSFSVGAVDNNKVIGDFSSRGPSSCDTTQIKPEVVAPGVLVRSSSKDGG